MSSFARTPDARARLGRWFLGAAILGSGLGLGAVHTEVLAMSALLAAAGMAFTWWDAEKVEPRRAASVLVLTAVALVAWTIVQTIPLPHDFLATLAPANADVWARALRPLHESGPRFSSISLDPSASRVQALRGVTYLCMFLGCLRVSSQTSGVLFLERALVSSAAIVAASAALHPVLGAQKVFGLYAPREPFAYDPHHIGPLLNVNHLAAFANVGVVLAFASLIEEREAVPRPVAAVLVLLLGATTTWTGSRGGIASMLVGTLAVTAFAVLRRRPRGAKSSVPVGAVIGGLIGLGLTLFSAFDATRQKIAANDLFKVSLVRNSSELLARYGVFGVGRGAFESTFPELRRGADYWVHTHPENVIVQWATEWGLPSLVAGAAILVALRPRTALVRSRPPAGAWAVLVTALLHNLVDFSSEIPAVMIALSACAGMVAGGSGNRERLGRWAARPRAVIGVAVSATLLGVGATLPFVRHELSAEQYAVRDVALDRQVSRADFEARARAAMLRHPAEPYFAFVGAVRSVVADESPVPWAARALERSPVYGRVHLVLARWLFRRNMSQARFEYRTACEQDSEACKVQEALVLVRSFDDAMDLVPSGVRGPGTLAFLAGGLANRLPATVVALDRELVARDPRATEPVRRAATAVLLDVRNEESWCDESQRSSCVDSGLDAAMRLRAGAPERCEGHALTAELRVASGDVDAALSDLERALNEVIDRSACARRLVELSLRSGNQARLTAALDRLVQGGCEVERDCVDNLVFAADIELGRGSSRHGLALLRSAWERSPEREDILLRVAQTAVAQGVHGDALDAYQVLADRHPDDPRWSANVARERAAVAKSVFQRQ